MCNVLDVVAVGKRRIQQNSRFLVLIRDNIPASKPGAQSGIVD
jgi:hypothetical protein